MLGDGGRAEDHEPGAGPERLQVHLDRPEVVGERLQRRFAADQQRRCAGDGRGVELGAAQRAGQRAPGPEEELLPRPAGRCAVGTDGGGQHDLLACLQAAGRLDQRIGAGIRPAHGRECTGAARGVP